MNGFAIGFQLDFFIWRMFELRNNLNPFHQNSFFFPIDILMWNYANNNCSARHGNIVLFIIPFVQIIFFVVIVNAVHFKF